MAFFRNRAVNLLNLHYGIHAAALSGGGAFFFVYFLKNGFAPATVLLFIAAVLFGRFLIRPLILPVGVRWGVRRLLILGTLVVAIQYPMLAEVAGVGPLLIALCIVSAIGDAIYWTSYHAYFAALGDHEHRGHQLGAREALTAIVGIVSPLATGLILVEFGPRVKAKSILAGGESGDPASPHFNDQAERYAKVQFKDVLYYREDIERHAARTYHPGN